MPGDRRLMHRPLPIDHVRAGLRHLRSADPVLREVIQQVGPCRMTVDPDGFRSLVRSILSQQISGSAARSIGRRVDALVAPGKVSARALLTLAPEQLRSAGVSP